VIVINFKVASRYILNFTTLKDGRTVEDQLLGGAIFGVAMTVGMFVFLWIYDGFEYSLGDAFSVIPLAMLPIIPIVATIVVVISKKQALRFKTNDETYNGNVVGISGGISGTMSILWSRFFPPREFVSSAIIILILMVFSIAISSAIATKYIYKLHLLKKYCPEIVDSKNIEELRQASRKP